MSKPDFCQQCRYPQLPPPLPAAAGANRRQRKKKEDILPKYSCASQLHTTACMRPTVCDARYLSIKPCDRSDVVDAWPDKDRSGRQWWFLNPDGGASEPDMNGKPVNIRVRGDGGAWLACMVPRP